MGAHTDTEITALRKQVKRQQQKLLNKGRASEAVTAAAHTQPSQLTAHTKRSVV